jgi:hypothetical protein
LSGRDGIRVTDGLPDAGKSFGTKILSCTF